MTTREARSILTTLFVLLAVSHPVRAVTALPETQCFATAASGSQIALPAFPAGFFGAGSDAMSGRIVAMIGAQLPQGALASCPGSPIVRFGSIQKGGTELGPCTDPSCWKDPLIPNWCHCIDFDNSRSSFKSLPVSCVARRDDSLDFGTQLGGPLNARTEILALSMINDPNSPLVVTFNGGTGAQNWSVALSTDPNLPPSTGSMTFTPTFQSGPKVSGNTYLGALPMTYTLTFSHPPDPPKVLAGQTISFSGAQGSFTTPDVPVVPALDAVGLAFLGALVVVASLFLLRPR